MISPTRDTLARAHRYRAGRWTTDAGSAAAYAHRSVSRAGRATSLRATTPEPRAAADRRAGTAGQGGRHRRCPLIRSGADYHGGIVQRSRRLAIRFDGAVFRRLGMRGEQCQVGPPRPESQGRVDLSPALLALPCCWGGALESSPTFPFRLRRRAVLVQPRFAAHCRVVRTRFGVIACPRRRRIGTWRCHR